MSNAQNPSSDQPNGTRGRTTVFGWLGQLALTATATVILLGLGAMGIAALHARAELDARPTIAAPVQVTTMTVRLVPGYERQSSYVGRLEAARSTAVAFERAGRVIRVTVDEGDDVRQGQVIAELDTAQLLARRDQARAQLRALQAQRDLAQLTFGRQSDLKKKGWSPDQRFDEAQAELARLAATVDQVTAQIAAIDIDIAKSKLKAPFSGRIAKRSIDEGAVIMPGSAIVEVLETSRLQARIGMPPRVAATLEKQRAYTLRSHDQDHKATLLSRRPDLASGTRTMTMLFQLSDSDTRVPIGDLVTIELAETVNERGAWVPLAALKEGRRGLWTILSVSEGEKGQVVRREAVELLYARDGQAFVRGTFKDGARVISQGTGRVIAGQRVALVGE